MYLFLSKMRTKATERVEASSGQLDNVYILVLACVSLFVRLWGFNGSAVESDIPTLTMIDDYANSRFFIDSNPPFVTLFYYQLSRFLGSDQSTVLNLKYINVILGTLTVLLCFKTLKLIKLPSALAFWGSSVISLENSTLIEQRLITVYGLYLFLLSLFIFSFKSLQSIQLFNFKWWRVLITSSILLGLIISSHWTGPFVLIYSLYLSASELWYLIDDISIPANRLYSSFFTKVISNIIISLTVYLAVWKVHFEILDSHGRSYNLVSPKFQNSLNDNHLRFLNEDVLFGSKIMLRNYKTGVYLHSHDDTFRTGHQQVTGYWSFNDADNLFQIQSNDFSKDASLLLETEFKINHPFKVKLFHQKTQSFLRIDPQSRPPISEQEYNSEVTTDRDIVVSEDESDNENIVFQLRISNDYTWNDESRKYIKSLSSLFQIYNENNECYILSSDVELTEGLSSGQSELICIKEPAVEASLWFVDWSDHPKNSADKVVNIPEISFWEKLFEVLKIMVNDNIQGKKGLGLGYKEGAGNASLGGKLNDLMYASRGYQIWTDGSHVIYQIANVVTVHVILAAIVLFGLIFSFQFITWNPFDSINAPIDSTLKVFNYQTLDFMVGYILSIIPLYIVDYPIFPSSYTPSIYIGVMIVVEVINIIRYYNRGVGLLVLGIISPLIFLSFWKFQPIIYGTVWTMEACSKLMIVPGWDKDICKLYN